MLGCAERSEPKAPGRSICGTSGPSGPGWRTEGWTRNRCGMEGPSAGAGLRPGHRQLHAGLPPQLFPFCRVDRVPSEVCEHPAATVSGKSAGADPPGLSTPHRYRPPVGKNQIGTAVGEHCRHRRAGVRGAIPHRGGGPKGQGGDLLEGENLLL